MLKNSKTDWGSVSKSFHWLTLLLLIALFTLGWIMVDMAFSPNKFKFYSWHKSLGMIVLALTALRLSWRWVNRVPKHADNKLEQVYCQYGPQRFVRSPLCHSSYWLANEFSRWLNR